MIYNFLPGTNIKISKICLGTMTFGEQNTQKEAFEQMDYAISKGINIFDTAEMYSVPMKKETYGKTEEIIGEWILNNNRNDIFIATKAAGPGPLHIRNNPNFSRKQLTEALNNSLKRLKTDYIDLYQLHWPERNSPRFGQLNYSHKPIDNTPFEEILKTLDDFIKEGKIRYIGISNETAWGMMKFLQISTLNDLPKYVTIQNPYSLINRVFEISNSEICFQENIGLLAYSPLGGGLLSGKYLNNNLPKGSRYQLFPNYFGRYKHLNTIKAIEEYSNLAIEYGLNLTQMALSFVNMQEFVLSNIIGATTMEQLKQNIDSINISLSDDIIKKINIIHLKYQNPAP